MKKIKAKDTVLVTAGKDKGKEGVVEKYIADGDLLLVEGVNMYKKHVKGSQGQKGGIYDIPKPLSVAKVALVCPSCKKQTRVGFKIEKKEKLRICKKCGKKIVKGK